MIRMIIKDSSISKRNIIKDSSIEKNCLKLRIIRVTVCEKSI